MTTWDDVSDLIDKCDADGVAALVAVVDDQTGREIAKRLPELVKHYRGYHFSGTGGHAEALRAAGAGTIATPKAVASWLTRRGLVGSRDAVTDTTRLLGLIRLRPPAWQADLAALLAAKLRANDPSYSLTATLIHQTGIAVPTDDGFVVNWLDGWRAPEIVAADPLLDALLPRIFHAQGVGEALQWEAEPDKGWLHALTELAAGGRIDRVMLLDGCLGRFLRGGSALELRFFARLHAALEPTQAEVQDRARDYLRLLPTAPGPVAEQAQYQVRRLPPPDPAEFAEAVQSLLYRPEKKLVRAGLSWLDQVLKVAPEHAELAAEAVAIAFAHEASDIQERAVRLALKHELTGLSEAAAALPADLRAQLTGEQEDVRPAEPTGVLAAPQLLPRELPPPITTPAELGAAVAKVATEWISWLAAERLMAALVELTHQDREAVRQALRPALDRRFQWLYGNDGGNPIAWLLAACREIAGAGPRTAPPYLPGPRSAAAPHLFVLQRTAEIYRAAKTGALPPLLLATPTATNGQLDPAELLTRLERLEAAGAEPLPADLQQALLRLPRSIEPGLAERAGRLTSEAGQQVTDWLTGEREYPSSSVRYSYLDGASRRWFDDGEPPRFSCYDPRLVAFLSSRPTGLPLIDALHGEPDQYLEHSGCVAWWPGIMPSRMEVIAAHLVTLYYRRWGQDRPGAWALRGFAGADGSLGPAAATLLIAQLGHDDPAERAPGLDLLLALAATGALPAHDLGEQLGHLVRYELAVLTRITPALAEAARAGAQMWPVVAAALPQLLPQEGERPRSGLADLIALGVATAPPGSAAAIQGLAEFAARGGSSRSVREAVRLLS